MLSECKRVIGQIFSGTNSDNTPEYLLKIFLVLRGSFIHSFIHIHPSVTRSSYHIRGPNDLFMLLYFRIPDYGSTRTLSGIALCMDPCCQNVGSKGVIDQLWILEPKASRQ